jgi:hypothetical protein
MILFLTSQDLPLSCTMIPLATHWILCCPISPVEWIQGASGWIWPVIIYATGAAGGLIIE